jgi:hypothetical protein
VYTRQQVKEAYDLHRRGKLVGEAWDRVEREIVAAAAAGRIAGAMDWLGK